MNINICSNSVHIWRLFLPDFIHEIPTFVKLLNHDELVRAERFHFPLHQERFTMTRGLLRKTLNLYTGMDPWTLVFDYSEHGKPFLTHPDSNIKFNVSHSHDMAIFAFTVYKEIGVDIEKMESSFKESVAKRFFSPDEYHELINLPELERVIAFYKIWSRKEALIKALGKGLYTPLDSFSVSSQKDSQTVLCNADDYFIKQLNINPNYQAAFATLEPVTDIIEWEWSKNNPQIVNNPS